jgi:hypothetical protein
MRLSEDLYVKKAFEFVDKIKDHAIRHVATMVSFDVEALFPSIPVEEAIKLLKKCTVKKNRVNFCFVTCFECRFFTTRVKKHI